MVLIHITLVMLTSVLFCFILYNFPWISRYWSPDIEKFVVKKGGKIALVSDVHIDADSLDIDWIRIIGKTVEKLSIDFLIVVGDLVNKRLYIDINYLEKFARVVTNIMDLRNTVILYVPSNSAHDLALYSQKKGGIRFRFLDRNVEFIYTVHMLRIDFEECSESIYVTHGDYISRNGVLSYLLDKVGRKMFKKLFTGVIGRKILDLDNRSWIVVGHSHVSYLDRSYRAIGLGCWIKRYYAPRESSIAIASCRNKSLNIRFISLDKRSY